MCSSKINHIVALVLYLFINVVSSAPMDLQTLPLQYRMPQLPFLKQMVPNFQPPAMYPQQPLVIVLPNGLHNTETDSRYANLNEQVQNNNSKGNTGHIDENKEAVVIEPNLKVPETQPKNAIVYLPEEGRFSLGQIISYIPFLPVEVNVPDTISWITNLITGGWFKPQGHISPANTRFANNGQTPIIVMNYPGFIPQV